MATTRTTEKPRLVAKYRGSSVHTRVITKSDADKHLFIDLENDLIWSAQNRHMLDVTDLPAEMIEYLKSDKDFTVSERSGANAAEVPSPEDVEMPTAEQGGDLGGHVVAPTPGGVGATTYTNSASA